MPREKIRISLEEIEEAKSKFHTYTEQAKYLGVSDDVYRRERERAEKLKQFQNKVQYLTERDPKLELTKEKSIAILKKECEEIYSRSRKTIGYNEVTFDLGDDDAGVKLDCDWHIGNEMTNLPLWAQDIETTIKIPRLFTVLDGDYTDNLDAISKGYESIITVPEAKDKVKDAVMMMGRKILGTVQGCHDEWFFKQDSWDISQYLADHSDGYWLGFRGILNLIIGEQKYRIYVRHKYRRHSTDNETWGMLYKFRKLKEPVDIMMGAHHHHPVISSVFERGQLVYLCQGGSYKPYDRFIEHRDIVEGTPLMPAFLLRADRHEIIPFIDFNEIEDYL